MVELILRNSPHTHGELQKFERILEAWNMKITDRRADGTQNTITIVVDARYFSQANLVLAIAGNNFKGSLLHHNCSYEPDPPERY